MLFCAILSVLIFLSFVFLVIARYNTSQYLGGGTASSLLSLHESVLSIAEFRQIFVWVVSLGTLFLEQVYLLSKVSNTFLDGIICIPLFEGGITHMPYFLLHFRLEFRFFLAGLDDLVFYSGQLVLPSSIYI